MKAILPHSVMGAVFTFIAALVLSVGMIDTAEAKRMGGGKSFGGKNSFNQPAQNRQQSNASQSNSSGTQQQSAAQTQNAGQRAALAGRGGIMGMLGGLALGGLLGALFFGGAFENINFMDVLIFALIAFVLYKVFAARKRASQAQMQPATASYAPADMANDTMAPRQERSGAPFETDLLFKNKGSGAIIEPGADTLRPLPGVIPKDFDSTAFVAGAEQAYRRLQQAWDEGDLADLRQFTTDKVFGELQDQIRARSGENRTELLKIECELLEVREVGADTEATVLFDVLMREIDTDTADHKQVNPVREIWHFTRPTRSKQPTWYLDGIQQIEGS